MFRTDGDWWLHCPGQIQTPGGCINGVLLTHNSGGDCNWDGLAISTVYKENSPTTLIVEGVFNSASSGILIYMVLVDVLVSDFMNAGVQASKLLQHCTPYRVRCNVHDSHVGVNFIINNTVYVCLCLVLS